VSIARAASNNWSLIRSSPSRNEGISGFRDFGAAIPQSRNPSRLDLPPRPVRRVRDHLADVRGQPAAADPLDPADGLVPVDDRHRAVARLTADRGQPALAGRLGFVPRGAIAQGRGLPAGVRRAATAEGNYAERHQLGLLS
jgi:hypothetical protein